MPINLTGPAQMAVGAVGAHKIITGQQQINKEHTDLIARLHARVADPEHAQKMGDLGKKFMANSAAMARAYASPDGDTIDANAGTFAALNQIQQTMQSRSQVGNFRDILKQAAADEENSVLSLFTAMNDRAVADQLKGGKK